MSISVNLTNLGDFSINTIDKITHVCYNKRQLDNKTKNLTNNKNKNNKKQKGQKMEKIQLPNQVIDSDWKDDIDYEPYGNEKQEMEYIAPSEVSKESIEKIKARKLNQERGHKVFLFSKNADLFA